MKGILAGLCAFMFTFANLLSGAEQAAAKVAPIKTIYVCDKCHTAALKAGKCTCGADLVSKHLLMVKEGNACCCTCGGGCKCETKGEDATTCGCGKPIEKVSVKGLYVCGCAPGCKKCEVISDKAGKCACGKEMELVK